MATIRSGVEPTASSSLTSTVIERQRTSWMMAAVCFALVKGLVSRWVGASRSAMRPLAAWRT